MGILRIAVISPERQAGCTTLSILLAETLAKVYNNRTLLNYTGLENRGFETYLALNTKKDVTRSLTYVQKLMQTNNISAEEIFDYCTRIDEKLLVLDTNTVGIKESTATEILNRCLKGASSSNDYDPTDFFITDITAEIYENTTQEILKDSDMIFVILRQDKNCYEKFLNWRNSDCFKDCLPKCLFVINQYNPVIGSLRDVAKEIKVRADKVCKMDYNPYITKMANRGQLVNIVKFILERDANVISLNTSLKECINLIARNGGFAVKWWGSERR